MSRAPRDWEKGLVKGEALRLLRINSSIKTFEGNIATFKKQLMKGGYPQNFINNTLPKVKYQERTQALIPLTKQNKKRMLSFITERHQGIPNLKEMRKW